VAWRGTTDGAMLLAQPKRHFFNSETGHAVTNLKHDKKPLATGKRERESNYCNIYINTALPLSPAAQLRRNPFDTGCGAYPCSSMREFPAGSASTIELLNWLPSEYP